MTARAAQAVNLPDRAYFDFNDAVDVAVAVHYDKDELRGRLLDRLESVLTSLLQQGKYHARTFLVGNLQGDPGDTLVVELDGDKRGLWIDFATGESGDILALWAAVRGFMLPRDFCHLLDDVAGWLAVPRSNLPPIQAAASRSAPAYDDLGPATAKWNYQDTNGKLLAVVSRYDPPQGKQYRPWDVQARAMQIPQIRPLYNLPTISQSDVVVLVEGEKCADALSQLGIVATTAMGGAGAAIDKTDWSVLTGKTVVVWPDHDDAGSKYADAVIVKLQSMGAQVRRVAIPQDKPKKWDAADAVAEGCDVHSLLASSKNLKPVAISRFEVTQWRAVDRFVGEPKPRRWLVEGIFPLAQAALVAAGGGVGKSFLLLSLARDVAAFDGTSYNAPMLFWSDS